MIMIMIMYLYILVFAIPNVSEVLARIFRIIIINIEYQYMNIEFQYN